MTVTSIDVATAQYANPSGSIHGGWLMQLADKVGSIAAARYCGRRVVTARVTDMTFRHPAVVGDYLEISADVVKTGRSSLHVTVAIDATRNFQAEKIRILDAALILVCVDDQGMPMPIDAAANPPDERT